MSTDAATFGARFAAANPADRPALHAAEGDREAFADYDRVLGNLYDLAIRGTQILDLTLSRRRTESDVIALKVADEDRAVLAAVLAPEAQQARRLVRARGRQAAGRHGRVRPLG